MAATRIMKTKHSAPAESVRSAQKATRAPRAKNRAPKTVKIPYVSHEEMIRFAEKNPPPQSWFDETDIPFVPIRRKR